MSETDRVLPGPSPIPVEALRALTDALTAVEWVGPSTRREAWHSGGRSVLHHLEDYVLPRLGDAQAPFVVVIGGSTGAGKSTLINSITGTDLSEAGVRRPTTTRPTAFCHPQDAAHVRESLITRYLAAADGLPPVEVRATEMLRPGLVFFDTPDIDSVATDHHEIASAVLSLADLWLFVTTAARYADARWWEVLRTALNRQVATAILINRIPSGEASAVTEHLGQMVAENGTLAIPVFSITEQQLDQGRIPEPALIALQAWIQAVSTQGQERTELLQRNIWGTYRASVDQLSELLAQIAEYQRQVTQYRTRLRSVLSSDQVIEPILGTTLIRTEVLNQWVALIGATTWMRDLQVRVGQLRDRLLGRLRQETLQETAQIQSELQQALLDSLQGKVGRAYQIAVTTGVIDPALLGPQLRLPSPAAMNRLAEQIDAWHSDVLDLVRDQAGTRHRTARIAAGGVNAVALALILVAFASTGGLVGAEIAIAGGSAIVGQKLLEAIFGEDAVRRLAKETLALLSIRLTPIVEAELARFEALAPVPDVAAVNEALGALGERR